MSADTGSGQGLQKTIGLYGAVALALGIVLGAGMLSLPGLVYQIAGGQASLAWALDGLLVLPLLFVFATLGRRFPTAGGVAGFVGQAFPRLQVGCSYLLVGTFALGIPAIAVTGAGYVAGGAGYDGGAGGSWLLAGIAAALLFGVLGMAWFGARLAGTVQNVIVTLLVAGLFLAVAFSIPHWGGIDFAAGDPGWVDVWSGMGLAFFAYTGWEMLSFTAEEFKNPKRDYPLAVAISFLLVLMLYVGAALAVQALVPLDHALLGVAPLMVIGERVVGSSYGVMVLAALAAVIIVANLNGACWAASRLVFDIGRNGWSPARLSLGRLSGLSSVPRAAIVTVGVVFLAALTGYGAGFWGLGDMLRVAGQNFFLLYTLSIVAYVALATTKGARVFGVAALAVCVMFAGIFGWGLAYAAVLFGAPYAVTRTCTWVRARRQAPALGRSLGDTRRQQPIGSM